MHKEAIFLKATELQDLRFDFPRLGTTTDPESLAQSGVFSEDFRDRSPQMCENLHPYISSSSTGHFKVFLAPSFHKLLRQWAHKSAPIVTSSRKSGMPRHNKNNSTTPTVMSPFHWGHGRWNHTSTWSRNLRFRSDPKVQDFLGSLHFWKPPICKFARKIWTDHWTTSKQTKKVCKNWQSFQVFKDPPGNFSN